ncbi:MAG: protease modulator HflC [Fimbriimonadaceae bacterium]|nr:protease modulator HflC [Alphaproteobacteria bacterium]
MKSGITTGFLIIAALIAFVAYNSMFTVHQTQQALVLQFGEAKKVITEPGLNFKIPFVQEVIFIDNRILDLDSPAQEVIALGQKRLVVDAFARYKVTDPLKFFQRVSNVQLASTRLSPILNSAVRSVLGRATFEDIVRDNRPQLMREITQQVNQSTRTGDSEFGVTFIDVKIRRADLPEANSQAIFRRMQTERQQEAAELRARGQEASQRVRARADRDVTVLLANANRESQQTRGEGDAKRNAIFANAYGQDADFFDFYRSMQAYENSLGSSDTRLVLSPNSAFFKYFGNPDGIAANPSVGNRANPVGE